jgi:Tol biopolymer transport system component
MFQNKWKFFFLGLAIVAGAATDVLASPPQPDNPPTANEFRAPKERLILKGHDVMVWAAAFAPDGKSLATAAGLYNKPGQLIVWDVGTGRVKAKLDESLGIRALAFSPDGKLLATADYYANKVALRDPATGIVRQTLPTPHANNMVAFSPDSKTLAASILNEGIQGVLWDVATGSELKQLSGHTHWSSCVAFSGDGRLVATGSRDKTVKLWDVRIGTEVATFTGHQNLIEFLAFSPDGRTIASASWDKTVRLWEITSGKERAVLQEHKLQALGVAFSPDGRTLVTTGGEVLDSPVEVNLKQGEVKLWDVPSLAVFHSLETRQNGRMWMPCFSPDGSMLATVAEDKSVKLWDLPPRHASPRAVGEKELADCWDDLAGGNAAKAYRAVWTLALAQPAVPFLEKRLRPAEPPPAEERRRLDRLLLELDSDNFATRERASAELEKLGDAAEPALKKATRDSTSLEVRRRAERLLGRLRAPAQRPELLRTLRAVEALELARTPEARQFLQALAKGWEHDRLTWEAQAALTRLSK